MICKDGLKTRQNYEFDEKTFLQLENKVRFLPEYIDRKMINQVFDDFRQIKPLFDTLAAGLIHNDIALHNIIISNNKLSGIIDFSDIAFSPYIQNIAVSMSQLIFTYNWKPHQAKLFIDGYRNFHQISPEELDLLYDLTRVRYVLFIIEMNYWNKSHGIDKHRTDDIKDYNSFLQKFTTFGKNEFNTLLK